MAFSKDFRDLSQGESGKVVQRYQLPVQGRQLRDCCPKCPAAFIFKKDKLWGAVIRQVIRQWIGGCPLLTAAVVIPQVPADPQQPVPKGWDILRQAQVSFQKGFGNQILRCFPAAAEGDAVQQGRGVVFTV